MLLFEPCDLLTAFGGLSWDDGVEVDCVFKDVLLVEVDGKDEGDVKREFRTLLKVPGSSLFVTV